MHFLHPGDAGKEGTYDDVFIVPQINAVESRLDVDLAPTDELGLYFPAIVANMNAVAGRRMAETVARRGGLVVLSQDMTPQRIATAIGAVKHADPEVDSPVIIRRNTVASHISSLIRKRAHGAALVMHGDEPLGVVTLDDLRGIPELTTAKEIINNRELKIFSQDDEDLDAEAMLGWFTEVGHNYAPVVKKGKLRGVMTPDSVVRSTLYRPAVDKHDRLQVAAAVGINGNPAKKAKSLVGYGADVIVVDTAHGHQLKMLRALESVANAVDVPVVAGNVVMGHSDIKELQATQDLIRAGARGVKVGVGPGAMCSTRLQTGVGRPQFSAVVECAAAAREMGAFVWADGGVKHPRDVALALAAGASSVMIGTWFAGTYESAAELEKDANGRYYKETHGMASRRAVAARTVGESALTRARKALFEEGISTSKYWVNGGVEAILDEISGGLRSAMTYTGADDLAQFFEKVYVAYQTAAGRTEGNPVPTSW